ncbi:Tat-linked quality control protein TatD [Candidatus Tiddalikarchaeum anstoanum]|nr:Tat-linked quality control protein TatD [Candidatus Tiddalikarchaeum anstoanum]
MFYDLHSHLTNPLFDNDRAEIIKKCKAGGISVVLCGLDFDDNVNCLNLAMDGLFACFGMHPTMKFDDKIIGQIEEFKDKIIGIGEVGLDFKKGVSTSQMSNFKKIISLAERLNKPLIVHSRMAEKEVSEIVGSVSVPVVLHAFFGSKKIVETLLSFKNVFFSIPSSVFYDAQLQELVKLVPLDRLFCETDSPFLWKFGRNSPLNVVKSYEAISRVKNVDLAVVEREIASNFSKVFLKR